jgi:hypothetical protein
LASADDPHHQHSATISGQYADPADAMLACSIGVSHGDRVNATAAR